MVSRKEDKVDFDRLEKELDDAVQADQKYWRENDAKLRAVHQKVATYDEFRCDHTRLLSLFCLHSSLWIGTVAKRCKQVKVTLSF